MLASGVTTSQIDSAVESALEAGATGAKVTGAGGGALMAPMLVLLFNVKPSVAISSDLVAAVVMRPILPALSVNHSAPSESFTPEECASHSKHNSYALGLGGECSSPTSPTGCDFRDFWGV